jgi:hypothetical protein
MPRTLAGSTLRLCALLLPLGLVACAETPSPKETASSASLQRSYNQTLTKDERKSVIKDLQKATKKKKEQGEDAAEGEATPDQSAATQDAPAEAPPAE